MRDPLLRLRRGVHVRIGTDRRLRRWPIRCGGEADRRGRVLLRLRGARRRRRRGGTRRRREEAVRAQEDQLRRRGHCGAVPEGGGRPQDVRSSQPHVAPGDEVRVVLAERLLVVRAEESRVGGDLLHVVSVHAPLAPGGYQPPPPPRRRRCLRIAPPAVLGAGGPDPVRGRRRRDTDHARRRPVPPRRQGGEHPPRGRGRNREDQGTGREDPRPHGLRVGGALVRPPPRAVERAADHRGGGAAHHAPVPRPGALRRGREARTGRGARLRTRGRVVSGVPPLRADVRFVPVRDRMEG
mmetsp:Transcript_11091/g.32882  ORF Transcript_11091/g.32882 Transcript_11091/m.32882 type:complete len:296 (+) Transcript_11091:298-1185(+)